MGIFDFLNKESKQKANNFNHIKNLLTIAMSDGSLDEKETQALNGVSSRLGITNEEIGEIIKNFNNIKFVLPTNKKDRINQFWDLILIVLVDGKIEKGELNKLRTFAENLNIRSGVITAIIRNLETFDFVNTSLSSFRISFVDYFSDGNGFTD
ncbi:MAG: hypothetical protein PHE25_05045 [Candidatus Gracilibacteria bacterium]|nr:hypothetical protein [Candidatus Gracilibacteria bacterium]